MTLHFFAIPAQSPQPAQLVGQNKPIGVSGGYVLAGNAIAYSRLLGYHPRIKVMIAKKAPRYSRRFLDQQRQEGAFRQPQCQPARQCQQPGLSLLPELDELCVVESTRIMDQTSRPVRLGQFPIDKPQGTLCVGRLIGSSHQAESSTGCRLFYYAE